MANTKQCYPKYLSECKHIFVKLMKLFLLAAYRCSRINQLTNHEPTTNKSCLYCTVVSSINNLYQNFKRKLSQTSDLTQDEIRPHIRRLSDAIFEEAIEKNGNVFSKNYFNEFEPQGLAHNDDGPTSVVTTIADNPSIKNILKPYNHELLDCDMNVKRTKFVGPSFQKHEDPFTGSSTLISDNLKRFSCELCPAERAANNPNCCQNKTRKIKRQLSTEVIAKPLSSTSMMMEKSVPLLKPNSISLYPDITSKGSQELNLNNIQNQPGNPNLMTPSSLPPAPNNKDGNQFATLDSIWNFYGGGGDRSRVNLIPRESTNNTTTILNSSSANASGQQTSTTTMTQNENATNSSRCSNFADDGNNTTAAVLERILDELELIRQAKIGNSTPEGAPCDIIGSWNSELMGLRFDISTENRENSLNSGGGNSSSNSKNATAEASTPSSQPGNELDIKLFDHRPPKRSTLMDTEWFCRGYSLHFIGGPFYIAASKKRENIMATFTGQCTSCSGVDTIFGTWSIVHQAKDCRDLQMSIDSKRDIFRKSTYRTKSDFKTNSKDETKQV